MRGLFDFAGRASRLEYWRVYLASVIVGGAVMVATMLAIERVGPLGGAVLLALMPMLAISVATGVRRAHDRGRRAIWLWIFGLGPFALQVAANLMTERGGLLLLPAVLLILAAIGLALWGLVDLGFRGGTPGPNAYGDTPASRL